MGSADGVSLQECDDEEMDEAQQVLDAYESDPEINKLKDDGEGED